MQCWWLTVVTDRQVAANKANARKSTGPKSTVGKEASARNATRHGLNTSPAWKDVTSWYKIILDDPEAVPDVLTSNNIERAALVLAEAEAVRERATRMEENYFVFASKDTSLRKLSRYRRQSEARRRKALKNWIETKNSKNTKQTQFPP